MTYILTDGGRQAAGFKGAAGDCGVRAMAIALGIDYAVCYDELALANKAHGQPKSARNGILRNVYEHVLARHGYVWNSAPAISGRKARASDLPPGKLIARQAKHYVAVIDGVIYDTFDSSEKMVYGYWSKK